MPAWGRARGEIVHRLVGEHRELAVEQRDVEMLAEPAFLALHQRGEHAGGRIHAGHQVRHRDAHLFRTAARHAVGLARDAHQAAHALDQEVVTRAVR